MSETENIWDFGGENSKTKSKMWGFEEEENCSHHGGVWYY
jgi:hypothetical protein